VKQYDPNVLCILRISACVLRRLRWFVAWLKVVRRRLRWSTASSWAYLLTLWHHQTQVQTPQSSLQHLAHSTAWHHGPQALATTPS
jgi:hypothetical protein